MPVATAVKIEALKRDLRSGSAVADLLGVSRSRVTRWLQGAGIDPLNAERVDLLELVWSNLLRLYEPEAAGWKDAQKAIAGFAQVARELGVPLVVFHLPELRELKPYAFPDVTAKVKSVVEANGLRFVDLLPTVEAVDPANLWVTVPDPHPNGKADTAFAQGMTRDLLPLLESLCGKQSKGC